RHACPPGLLWVSARVASSERSQRRRVISPRSARHHHRRRDTAPAMVMLSRRAVGRSRQSVVRATGLATCRTGGRRTSSTRGCWTTWTGMTPRGYPGAADVLHGSSRRPDSPYDGESKRNPAEASIFDAFNVLRRCIAVVGSLALGYGAAMAEQSHRVYL